MHWVVIGRPGWVPAQLGVNGTVTFVAKPRPQPGHELSGSLRGGGTDFRDALSPSDGPAFSSLSRSLKAGGASGVWQCLQGTPQIGGSRKTDRDGPGHGGERVTLRFLLNGPVAQAGGSGRAGAGGGGADGLCTPTSSRGPRPAPSSLLAAGLNQERQHTDPRLLAALEKHEVSPGE